MTDYWFKPKTHGYGATPANWKGWAATLGYSVATLVVSTLLIVVPAAWKIGPGFWHIIAWVVAMAGLTLGFFRLCRLKTDGEWRWRWGNTAKKQ